MEGDMHPRGNFRQGISVTGLAGLVLVCAVVFVPRTAAMAMIAPQSEQPQIEEAALESRPLGSPNGLLDARPANTGSGSLMDSIDPRRSGTIRTVGSLVIVVGLILGCSWLFRRLGPAAVGGRSPAGVMQVMARYPMGRKQQLLLLQVGRRVVCCHQTPQGIRTITEIVDEDEIAQLRARIESGSASEKRGRPRFDQALRRSLGRFAKGSGRRSGIETVDLTRPRVRARHVQEVGS